MLTPEKLTDLRAKAEAATPGPWKADLRTGMAGIYPNKYDPNCMSEVPDKDMICTVDGLCQEDEHRLMDNQQGYNARYIAAANPQTILKLLDMVERLERERDWIACLAADYAINDRIVCTSADKILERARQAVEENKC